MFGVNVSGELVDGVVVGDIESAVHVDHPAQRPGIGDSLLQALGVAVGEKQFGALGGQLQRGRPADAAGGSGEKTTLAGEIAPR